MATTPVSAPRKTAFWLDDFLTYSEQIPSPTLFRKWAAISAVAAALERKVWVRTSGSNIYPNLYTVLVGPPGVGKTVITSEVALFYEKLKEHHLAPSSVTKASLIDSLADAKRKIIRVGENPSYVEFNSLFVISNELGVFLPSYEPEFMSALTDIFDGKRYAERRRTRDLKLEILFPQLSILAATTPSYLSGMLPEGAWDQGFTSRTIFVFSGERVIRPLFGETVLSDKLSGDLAIDLKAISEIYGPMKFEESAGALISDWHMAGGPPVPQHPKLTHYLPRRTMHLLKLCMVACAMRTSDKIITADDFEIALSWLLEAESFMPDIFKSMNSGGDGRIIEDCWYFVFQIYGKEKRGVAEPRIIQYLSGRVPAYNVMNVLNVMTNSRMLKKELGSGGIVLYVPLARKDFS